MVVTLLKPQYEIVANLRPVKFAYFVQDNDEESLKQILYLVCTQWGGIRNLIIPVDSNANFNPVYEQLLELHAPDRFVYFQKPDTSDTVENTLTSTLTKLFPNRK